MTALIVEIKSGIRLKASGCRGAATHQRPLLVFLRVFFRNAARLSLVSWGDVNRS